MIISEMSLLYLNFIRTYYHYLTNICCILSLTLLVQGCNSAPIPKTLFYTTTKQLQTNYKLDHADLIVRYNLVTSNKSNRIFAQDFGLIINNEDYNKIFLQKFQPNNSHNISHLSMIKVKQIKNLLLKLNNKHKFLPKDTIYFVNKPSTKESNEYINDLVKLDKLASTIPIMSPQYGTKVTSHYGMRKNPHNRKKKFHFGTDLQGSKATPIYAAASGLIIFMGTKKAYGNLVEIKHSNKFSTKYAHLKKIYVKEGDIVIQGQIIGLQGNSGNSTNEHLHFEILLNNKPINPWDFLAHACNY